MIKNNEIHRPLSGEIRKEQFHPSYLNRFKHIGTISEHTGCVNRLAWSEDGAVLASCSDDLQLSIWRFDKEDSTSCNVIQTSHTNNIYGLRFLPQNENKAIISGGIDGLVEVHKLTDDFRYQASSEKLYCHNLSVKYIETEPKSPYLFFSAGDDGCVRQYDSRLKNWGCNSVINTFNPVGSMYNSSNCLLQYKNGVKIHSVRVNPVDTQLIAVTNNSNKVHVYDRRMMSLKCPSIGDVEDPQSIASFCPEHLTNNHGAYSTYAEFSPCGKNILASFHSDNSYVFPLYESSRKEEVNVLDESDSNSIAAPLPWRIRLSEAKTRCEKNILAKEAIEIGTKALEIGLNITSYNMFTRAIDISQLSITINDIFDNEDNSLDIAKQTYINAVFLRAKVCEKRGFAGDDITGLEDIEIFLSNNPDDFDGLIKKCKFLLNLNRVTEAIEGLNKISYLLNIQSKDSNHLLYIQNEIDALRMKAACITLENRNNASNAASSTKHMTKKAKTNVESIQSLTTEALAQLPVQSNMLDSNKVVEENLQTRVRKRSNSEDYKNAALFSFVRQMSVTIRDDSPPVTSTGKRIASFDSLDSALLESTNNVAVATDKSLKVITKYSQRFIGASNIATDMKESVFLGSNGEYVAGGSDDGRFFIWDRFSGEILLCRSADPDVLSCIQGHPTLPIIATSGLDESVRIWGPGSLKTSFKGFNKNDPFKAQCGKLELPELSRMRLNRGVSPVYSSNGPHDEALLLPVTRNSSEEEKSSSVNRSGYNNSNSLSNSSQSASNSSTMASANNVLSSSEEGHSASNSDNGSSFNDNENETSVEEENGNGSTGSNRKGVAFTTVKKQLVSESVPVASNTNVTANNSKKMKKEKSDSSNNSDSNEEGYTGSDSFGTSSNNNNNTTNSSGSSNNSINKMKKSGSNKSLNALVTSNSNKDKNPETTSGSATCDQSNQDFSSSSNNSDKNSDNEMDVGLGGIFWEDRQNNCDKVPVNPEKGVSQQIVPTNSESKRISLSVYRKALKKAVEGHPMDADEALALEEIVAENQKLSKFNPSPLFYRQMSINHHSAWNNVNEENVVDTTVTEYSNANVNTGNNITLPAVLSSNHNCSQS